MISFHFDFYNILILENICPIFENVNGLRKGTNFIIDGWISFTKANHSQIKEVGTMYSIYAKFKETRNVLDLKMFDWPLLKQGNQRKLSNVLKETSLYQSGNLSI